MVISKVMTDATGICLKIAIFGFFQIHKRLTFIARRCSSYALPKTVSDPWFVYAINSSIRSPSHWKAVRPPDQRRTNRAKMSCKTTPQHTVRQFTYNNIWPYHVPTANHVNNVPWLHYLAQLLHLVGSLKTPPNDFGSHTRHAWSGVQTLMMLMLNENEKCDRFFLTLVKFFCQQINVWGPWKPHSVWIGLTCIGDLLEAYV